MKHSLADIVHFKYALTYLLTYRSVLHFHWNSNGSGINKWIYQL